jgi:hypothetical protein
MAQAILLSLLVATIALPVRAAREKNPRKGLRRAIVSVAVFNAIYLLLLIFVYGRFL